jgi:hypothetical protein
MTWRGKCSMSCSAWRAHPQVLFETEPDALFLSFGDVRPVRDACLTDRFDWVKIQSELTTPCTRRCRRRNRDPVPQREVRLRQG